MFAWYNICEQTILSRFVKLNGLNVRVPRFRCSFKRTYDINENIRWLWNSRPSYMYIVSLAFISGKKGSKNEKLFSRWVDGSSSALPELRQITYGISRQRGNDKNKLRILLFKNCFKETNKASSFDRRICSDRANSNISILQLNGITTARSGWNRVSVNPKSGHISRIIGWFNQIYMRGRR